LDSRDVARFERLLLPHLDASYTLARHLMRNSHDAQDVVQEAYLRAARYFHTFEGDDARPWLMTIVRRECLTAIARQRAEQTLPLEDPTLHLVDSHPSPDIAMSRASAREQIAAVVAELPPELRETLVLREVSDCSYREIAAITAAPIGTVMSRLARARARVAAQLRSTMDLEELA
jgi:RNA polymerase sigma-70 factor (ECF subfamily)